jgi:hypothetical protein
VECGRSCGYADRIAHGYLLVDAVIIRQTVTQDVPSIISRISHRLDTIHPATISEDQTQQPRPRTTTGRPMTQHIVNARAERQATWNDNWRHSGWRTSGCEISPGDRRRGTAA